KWFVPAHVTPSESISEVAQFNIQRLTEIKDYIFSICNGKSVEEIIVQADKDMQLGLNLDKYAKVTISVKGYLNALLEDHKITTVIQNSKMVYVKVN
ncbi:MAG: hypothetical protein NC110_01765, partial [Ruminococcus sp.]|nr:hypothetical protein [Ruminococcus sp.]